MNFNINFSNIALAKDLPQQLSEPPSQLGNDKDHIQFVILAICFLLVALLLISLPTYTVNSSYEQTTHHYIGDWHFTLEMNPITYTLIVTYENTEFQIVVFVALIINIAFLVYHKRRYAENRIFQT